MSPLPRRPVVRIVACWCLGLAAVAPAADWPQFLGPTRDGQCGETGFNWHWPAGGPPRAWTYPVGHGWSGPAVVGDRALVFHRVEDDDTLDCLDAGTGKRLWRWSRSTEYRDQFGF